MKLTELEARFIRHEYRDDTWQEEHDGVVINVSGRREYVITVKALEDAQGVAFLCPLCFTKNGGSVGTHWVHCWSRSRGTPEEVKPLPGRWVMDGTCLDDLTLNGEPGQSRSVLLLGGCAWHGFITNGEASLS